MSKRQPVFNLPGVILALLAAFAVVQVARDSISAETDAWLITTFGFIPARFSHHFAPAGLADAIVQEINSGVPESTVRYFLGEGGWPWWSPVTYTFLHGDWTHLGLNGLWLAAFGSAVARRFGAMRFAALFVLSGIAGAAGFFVVHPFGLEPVVGASAAISGAVAAAMRFAFEPGAPLGPGRNFSIADDGAYYVRALPLARVFRDGRALTFLLVWFGCNILFGAFARPLGVGDASVAWEAHIGGFLFGMFAFSFFDPMPDQRLAAEPEPEPEFDAPTSSQASGPRHVP
ncbi:MAG: rhomboid family intramembrane serine protease [Methylobacteriaceae bacterium]|nr:rhomboid family intramembrane serine protease [Methylobacteriaceae bacterium]